MQQILRDACRTPATPATPATREAGCGFQGNEGLATPGDSATLDFASRDSCRTESRTETARRGPACQDSRKSRESRRGSETVHLLSDIEDRVLAWLDHVGEHDAALRVGCVRACRRDPELREYILKRAEEMPVPEHERVLRDLETNPERVRAVEVIDKGSDPIRIVVAIRDVGVCELLVARDRWDPFQFLALLAKSTEQKMTDA